MIYNVSIKNGREATNIYMELRQISDDFFQIGNIALLYKSTGNDVYDFCFRDFFECKSIINGTDSPVLLHIGAIADYEKLEKTIENLGMTLLMGYDEHIRCSTIEKWYPILKDNTPHTRVYDELPDIEEIKEEFSFPIFIKGNRQTNRHNKAQCIIENEDAYEQLKLSWKNDSILSWQKVAVREYVKLQTIDSTSYPDMVPISYEFRFFCVKGKCVGYGPYWYMGHKYGIKHDDVVPAIRLAEWAAQSVGVSYIAVDLAKTVEGNWIVIEVNDAQESGFVGLNPLSLWNNTMEAMQIIEWTPEAKFFDENIVIMGCDPTPDVSIEEMNMIAKQAETEKDLADAYAMSTNKAQWVSDDVYDYDEGTEEYNNACRTTDEWFAVSDSLRNRIFRILKSEGVAIPKQGYNEVMKPFMERNGYRDGRGWWVKDNE